MLVYLILILFAPNIFTGAEFTYGHTCTIKELLCVPEDFDYQIVQMTMKAKHPICMIKTNNYLPANSSCSLNFYWNDLKSNEVLCGLEINQTYNIVRGTTPESWVIANMDRNPTFFQYNIKIIKQGNNELPYEPSIFRKIGELILMGTGLFCACAIAIITIIFIDEIHSRIA
jgi:hypothetical protein